MKATPLKLYDRMCSYLVGLLVMTCSWVCCATKHGPFKMCRCFQLFFIDFKLFYCLFRIIRCHKNISCIFSTSV